MIITWRNKLLLINRYFFINAAQSIRLQYALPEAREL